MVSLPVFLMARPPEKMDSKALNINSPPMLAVIPPPEHVLARGPVEAVCVQSRSPSLRSSRRNARLWDNLLPEARNSG